MVEKYILNGVVCVVILPFWHFCWCRGFWHRTESDLFLFSLNDGQFDLVSLQGLVMSMSLLVVFKCPFYCTAIAWSGYLRPWSIGFTTPVGWLLSLKKSVRNSCVIARFVTFLFLWLCSVCRLGVFIIRLRHISFLFSLYHANIYEMNFTFRVLLVYHENGSVHTLCITRVSALWTKCLHRPIVIINQQYTKGEIYFIY